MCTKNHEEKEFNKQKKRKNHLIDLIGMPFITFRTQICFLKKLNPDLYTMTFDRFKLYFYVKKKHNLTDLPSNVGRA